MSRRTNRSNRLPQNLNRPIEIIPIAGSIAPITPIIGSGTIVPSQPGLLTSSRGPLLEPIIPGNYPSTGTSSLLVNLINTPLPGIRTNQPPLSNNGAIRQISPVSSVGTNLTSPLIQTVPSVFPVSPNISPVLSPSLSQGISPITRNISQGIPLNLSPMVTQSVFPTGSPIASPSLIRPITISMNARSSQTSPAGSLAPVSILSSASTPPLNMPSLSPTRSPVVSTSLLPRTLPPSISPIKSTVPTSSLSDSGVECPVCLTETVKKSELMTCGHPVCRECLACLNKPSCPTCRAELAGPLITPEIRRKIFGAEESGKEIEKIKKQIQTEVAGYFFSLFNEIMIEFYDAGVLTEMVETPVQKILDAISEENLVSLLVNGPESEQWIRSAQIVCYLLWRAFVNALGRPSYYSTEDLQMVNLLPVLDDVTESIYDDLIYMNIMDGLKEILTNLREKYDSFGLYKLA